ncbi:MAG: ATP-binding cassette domain-containing protein [Alphaproteobacteria bacterium]|nr:ATP-binding cassette domain-containing protein [Alphaproteobacteria bacterium]MBV9371336.1 ATP-binding cassette domain-containing protein [Alphaproteobacteria bacterium]MBV9901800.1 ATP-binding cassette domain-containing protein [Alphaproteobacteria bacterium]
MTATAAKPRERRWLAVEVVQTSTMDCGPAALKCLLEGYRVPISLGRLREACQTDVDGTSIDTLEELAVDLGLAAEQALVPVDHVTLSSAEALPAIVVLVRPGGLHFVVAWRRHGRWLQVMDPAVGRRWVSVRQFEKEIYPHEQEVDAADWREWAGTDAFLGPLRERMDRLGAARGMADDLVHGALKAPDWHPIGALDACVRLVQSLVEAGGVRRGAEAGRVLRGLFDDETRERRRTGRDSLIPEPFWSVLAGNAETQAAAGKLKVRGAVILGISGLRPAGEAASAAARPLSLELATALAEKPDPPLAALWRMLGEDGLLAPLALVLAAVFAVSAAMVEALLFRGIFDISAQLALPAQRLFAAAGLVLFAAILLAIEYASGLGTLRWGRKLEARLRMALLAKLPRLNDRYFHSRPISDMADRSHNIHAVRAVPALGLRLVQSVLELAVTFLGVLILAPGAWLLATLLALAAVAIPFTTQHLLNERDLRIRNHAGALNSFYLDALLGLAPIRAHRAERSVQGQHEGLLVEWARSLRGMINLALATDAAQSLVATALVGALLFTHFLSAGRVSGSDLLLVFWALKLPALGGQIARIAHQYPAQRNVLSRLLEPLAAPEEAALPGAAREAPPGRGAGGDGGVALEFRGGSVLAAGQTILRDVDLSIAPGEHVAIVGLSGAGKSSLLGLLLGWHRLASGRLLIDGAPAQGRDIEAMRRVTAWVDPAIQIWNRSLLDNLGYASADDGATGIGEVIAAARLRGVAQKLPQGLQTLLGEGGGLVSGGEGQRVRLARALLSPGTRLALLDEPFRGMDRTQRRALLAEARQWWKPVTLLCVTHDVAETLEFDRVLVVEDGRIIEDGAPRRLAAGASRYRDLLEAEKAVGDTIWQGDFWRRLTLAGGRLQATGEPG